MAQLVWKDRPTTAIAPEQTKQSPAVRTTTGAPLRRVPHFLTDSHSVTQTGPYRSVLLSSRLAGLKVQTYAKGHWQMTGATGVSSPCGASYLELILLTAAQPCGWHLGWNFPVP